MPLGEVEEEVRLVRIETPEASTPVLDPRRSESQQEAVGPGRDPQGKALLGWEKPCL